MECQAPAVFHRFRHLPPELRFEIWRLTWQPRTVSILAWRDWQGRWCFGRSKSRVPNTLYVNQESRYETLRFYKQAFAFSFDTQIPHPKMRYTRFSYFNFHLDTLSIISTHQILDIPFQDSHDLARLQRLIIPEPCWMRWGAPKQPPPPLNTRVPRLRSILKAKFPSLRVITLTRHKKYLSDANTPTLLAHGWRWGRMRSTVLGDLTVRHTPACESSSVTDVPLGLYDWWIMGTNLLSILRSEYKYSLEQNYLLVKAAMRPSKPLEDDPVEAAIDWIISNS